MIKRAKQSSGMCVWEFYCICRCFVAHEARQPFVYQSDAEGSRPYESLLPFARAGGVAREAAAALSGNERLDFHLVQTSLTRAARR